MNMASMHCVLTIKRVHSPPVAEMVSFTGLSARRRGGLAQCYRIGEDKDSGCKN